jgi:hypothetical protein
MYIETTQAGIIPVELAVSRFTTPYNSASSRQREAQRLQIANRLNRRDVFGSIIQSIAGSLVTAFSASANWSQEQAGSANIERPAVSRRDGCSIARSQKSSLDQRNA